MRSLVTGGAGFIGSHVARHCLALGHDVTVLDDLSGGFADQVPHGARFVEGSVTDVGSRVAPLRREAVSTTSTTSRPTPPRGCRTSSAASTTRTT